MKRLCVAPSRFVVVGGFVRLAHEADILEQILVKVNGDIITKTELEQRQIAALRQRDPNFRPGTDAELQKALAEVTPEVIVNAVDELLLVQRGRELGYTLGNEQFHSIVENIKKENKLETEEQFQAALKQEGMTLDDLRRQLERNMLVSRVQQVEVMGKIASPKTRSRSTTSEHSDAFTTQPQLTLREILVAVPDERQGHQRRRRRRGEGEGRGHAQARRGAASRLRSSRRSCRIRRRRPTAG